MRFRLTLHVKRGSVLPLNYQYPISSWIYKCINRADSEFARFLHEQGYNTAGKPYKFFTFSRLNVPRREIYQDRMIVKSREVSLIVSFLIEGAAEKFITGLFQNQHIGIGDAKSQVDFEVGRIEALPTSLSEKITVKTLSPIVVAKPRLDENKMRAEYLSPEDEGYAQYLFGNLVRKYESYHRWVSQEPPKFGFPDFSAPGTGPEGFAFELVGNRVQSRLVTVKAGTPQESKIKGYDFTFQLSAPNELIRVGLMAGWGEKNSLGFGSGEVVEKRILKSRINENKYKNKSQYFHSTL